MKRECSELEGVFFWMGLLRLYIIQKYTITWLLQLLSVKNVHVYTQASLTELKMILSMACMTPGMENELH